MTRLNVVEALRRRARTDGSAPLLTYYDLATGERTELSVATFANWVNKAGNLLGAYEAADGGTLAAPLALTHPGHWISLLLPVAAWQSGTRYLAVGAGTASGADLVVTGPEAPAVIVPGATFACSLDPFARPLANLPDGVQDFTSEVLAQPDAPWILPPVVGSDAAWQDADRRLTHAEVAALRGVGGRVLVRPSTAWETVRAAVVAPLLGGGSAVVVAGDADDARIGRIRDSERCVE